MDRRGLLRVVAGAAGAVALGEVAGGVAAAAAPRALVGYTAKASVPGVDDADQLDALTGRKAGVVRMYAGGSVGVPSSLDGRPYVGAQLREGRAVVLSFKVSDTSSLAAVEAFCADATAQGFASRISATVHHEPYPELTGPQFVALYNAYGAVFRRYGIACGPIHQVWPFNHGNANLADYMPADDGPWDFVGVDTYPGDDPDHYGANPFRDGQGTLLHPLAMVAVVSDYAKARGKRYGVAETGVPSGTLTAYPDDAVAWYTRYAEAGASCAFFCHWNDADDGLENDGALLVPAWRHVYDTLD